MDGGSVAHNGLVQDAQQKYDNEVGLTEGKGNNGALHEARMHLLEVSNAVTQEVLNDILGELQLDETAANSIRLIAEAIVRGMTN